MAKTFQMGAKMTLKDGFKSVISGISRSTMDFKKNVDNANRSVNTFRDSTGRLRDNTGRYVSEGKKATAMTRTWIGANGKLNSSISFISRGVKGAVAAFGLMKAKNWLLDANADMEAYKNTLTVVLKDEKKAVQTLAWAEKFAAKTPFEIPQIVEATTRMSAYGINAQKTLGIIGDMASVMGKDLMQAVEAVADAQTGELERLKEFGITKKMIEDQAKLMKVTVTNNKGQITDQKAFNAVLFTLMEKRFKGGMEMQSKTWKGMLSNAKDFMGRVGRTLGAPIFDALKVKLGGVLDWLGKLEQNGAFQKLQNGAAAFVSGVGNVFAYLKKVVNTFKPAFSGIWALAKPILTWVATSGIPLVISALKTAGDWVLKIASWFINNWSAVGPIIYGIAAAWGTYFAITKAIALYTKTWTAIQWALNVAMNMNPVGIVITAIGVLIGLIILLVKNFGKVKAVFASIWQGMKAQITAPVNFLLAAVNTIIRGLNSVKIDIPNWVPVIGGKKFGFSIPEIPYLAKGTKNWMGGPAFMNEKGGELAILPGGSQVIPADKTDKILDKPAGPSISIQNLVGKLEIQQQPGEDAESFATRIIEILLEKLGNAAEIANNEEMGALVNG